MKSIGVLQRIMLLVSQPSTNNRWVYTMHGLEKPMDHVSAGGVMAGSVATIAVLWVFVQTMGFLGPSNSIGAFKLPFILETYLTGSKGLPVWEPGHAPVLEVDAHSSKRIPPIDQVSLNASVKYASDVISRLERIEQNLENSGVVPKGGSPAYSQYVYGRPNADALEKGLRALVAIGASKQLSQAHCLRHGLNEIECARVIATLQLDHTALGGSCMADQKTDAACEANYEYRSLDGSCNNLQNPKWGSAFTAYSRLLFPRYADGIQMPRRERGVRGLPNPRAVSVSLISNNERIDVTKSLALMEWSQFVAHDIAYTPVRKMIWTGKPISCCTANGGWPLPRYIHPDCEAISVPDSDPVYGKHGIRCLNYVRSMPVLNADCTFGPAEQMNQVSHFLDGSTIYGSTLNKSSSIRAFEGGLLRVSVKNHKEYLPLVPNSRCGSKNCYLTGDERANAEPQLAVMHTLWAREHNRVARKLAEINPEWSDERLYQEARRIVVAEIQHITYKEWLPAVIGERFASNVGLNIAATNYSDVEYSYYKEPSVSNEVATAALRFVSSLKQSKLSLTDNARQINDSMRLSESFYKPRSIETEDVFDGLVRGLATQAAQKMDLNVIQDVTQDLYKTDGPVGLDQISFDIQRGRDHGLPGYNDYRKHCGLKHAKKFDDFLDYIPIDAVKKLRTLYKHPDDVDLVIGGMAERPVEDAMLGPTFRCLVSMQFLKTRQTDRYFYDSVDQPKPFTLRQLNSLKKVSLARIFCDNGNSITKMQPNVLLKPQKGNELTPCKNFEKIPSIDLFAWAEKAKAYR